MQTKRIQISIKESNYEKLIQAAEEANKDFQAGKVTPSSCIEYAIEKTKFDSEQLRKNNMDLNKVLSLALKAKSAQERKRLLNIANTIPDDNMTSKRRGRKPKVENSTQENQA